MLIGIAECDISLSHAKSVQQLSIVWEPGEAPLADIQDRQQREVTCRLACGSACLRGNAAAAAPQALISISIVFSLRQETLHYVCTTADGGGGCLHAVFTRLMC